MSKSAAILGVVNAVMALFLAFGLAISDAQQVAITGVVNALLILGAVLLDPKVPFGKVE